MSPLHRLRRWRLRRRLRRSGLIRIRDFRATAASGHVWLDIEDELGRQTHYQMDSATSLRLHRELRKAGRRADTH